MTMGDPETLLKDNMLLLEDLKETRKALKTFIEYVEEQNLLMAEVFLANVYNADTLDQLFVKQCGHSVQEFVWMYEIYCREARIRQIFRKEHLTVYTRDRKL